MWCRAGSGVPNLNPNCARAHARHVARAAACPRRARVSVRMDSAGARTRAHWYGGVVVAQAEALDEHTVRFDDGEQMTLPLVSLIRSGRGATWQLACDLIFAILI